MMEAAGGIYHLRNGLPLLVQCPDGTICGTCGEVITETPEQRVDRQCKENAFWQWDARDNDRVVEPTRGIA